MDLCVYQALPPRTIDACIRFVISKGLADPRPEVSLAAMAAGRDIMAQYGDSMLRDLLPLLEVCLCVCF